MSWDGPEAAPREAERHWGTTFQPDSHPPGLNVFAVKWHAKRAADLATGRPAALFTPEVAWANLAPGAARRVRSARHRVDRSAHADDVKRVRRGQSSLSWASMRRTARESPSRTAGSNATAPGEARRSARDITSSRFLRRLGSSTVVENSLFRPRPVGSRAPALVRIDHCVACGMSDNKYSLIHRTIYGTVGPSRRILAPSVPYIPVRSLSSPTRCSLSAIS